MQICEHENIRTTFRAFSRSYLRRVERAGRLFLRATRNGFQMRDIHPFAHLRTYEQASEAIDSPCLLPGPKGARDYVAL
jgi:hypothetical protein